MSSYNYGNNSNRACGSSNFVCNGKSSRKGGNGGAGKHNREGGNRRSSRRGKRECLNCRSTDHSARGCPHSCGWCGKRGHKKDFCHRMKNGEPPCEGSPWTDTFRQDNPEMCVPVVEVQRKTYDATADYDSLCTGAAAVAPLTGYANTTKKFVTDEDLVALKMEQERTHMRMLKERTEVDYSPRVALKMHVEGCPCPNCRVPCGASVEEPELVVRKARRMNGNVSYTVTTLSGGDFSSWEEIPATEIPAANTNRKIQDCGTFCLYNGDTVVVVYLFVKDDTAEKTQISAINRDLTRGLPADMRVNFQVHKTVTPHGTPMCPPDAIVGIMMRDGVMPAELEIADLIWATGVFTYDEWKSFTDFCADKVAVLTDQQSQHQMDVDRFVKLGHEQVEFPTHVLFTVPEEIPPDVSERELKPLIERSVPGCLSGIRRGYDRISFVDRTVMMTRLPNLDRSIPCANTVQLERWESSVAEWFAKNQNGLVRQIRRKHKEQKEAAAVRKRAAASKALPTAQMTRSKGAHRSGAAKAKEVKGFGPTSKSSVGKCPAKSVEPVRKTETVEKPVVSDAEIAEFKRIVKSDSRSTEEEAFRQQILAKLRDLRQLNRLH